ncbi:hypothetical protein BF17_03130 [Yersinia similis]|uniref:Uncharacterized protein n=1 Tax=Yersinia similis TaxID=367190 RepID=A0ABM5Q3M0_9GAMM|nr:hypothetical protein BF17_03130 [Yersinia similis]
MGGGSGVYFQPNAPEQVCRFFQQFGRETGYTDQVGLDFIADSDGHFHVLECNQEGGKRDTNRREPI